MSLIAKYKTCVNNSCLNHVHFGNIDLNNHKDVSQCLSNVTKSIAGKNFTEFSNCDFQYASFSSETNLSEVVFVSCTFNNATFEKCKMNNTHFIECKFINTVLKDIDLSTTNIDDCDFTGATLERVILPANHNCQSIEKAKIIQ